MEEEEEEKGVEEGKRKGLVDGVKEQDRISIHSHTELVRRKQTLRCL